MGLDDALRIAENIEKESSVLEAEQARMQDKLKKEVSQLAGKATSALKGLCDNINSNPVAKKGVLVVAKDQRYSHEPLISLFDSYCLSLSHAGIAVLNNSTEVFVPFYHGDIEDNHFHPFTQESIMSRYLPSKNLADFLKRITPEEVAKRFGDCIKNRKYEYRES